MVLYLKLMILLVSPPHSLFLNTIVNLKTFLYSQIPYDPALKEKGYTIDDILNVTITYRKL